MAFPTITSVTTTTSSSAGDFTVNLPATVADGELLMLHAVCDYNVGAQTEPADWTELYGTNSTELGYIVCWKIGAAGDSGGTAVVNWQFTSGINVQCAQVFRIANYHGTQAPENSTGAGGNNHSPDPGSVTASWGSEDNMFLVLMGVTNDNSTLDTYPTNYTTVGRQYELAHDDATNYCRTYAVARDESAAATEDPGTFTLSGSQSHREVVVAIRPGAGGGGGRTMGSLASKGGLAGPGGIAGIGGGIAG